MLASEVLVVLAIAVMVLETTVSALLMTYWAISFSLTVRLCCMEIILATTAETTGVPPFRAVKLVFKIYHTMVEKAMKAAGNGRFCAMSINQKLSNCIIIIFK